MGNSKAYVLTASLLVTTLLLPMTGSAQILDGIVAIVEAQNMTGKPVRPQIITRSEVDEAVAPMLKRLEKSGAKVDIQRVRQKAFNELVMVALRKQKADQYSIEVTEQDIDVLMGNIERNNKIPKGKLPLVLQQQGIELSVYRRELGKKLLEKRLIDRVIKPLITVSEEEIQNLYLKTKGEMTGYEELRLGQILLAVDNGMPKSRVNQIAKKSIELSKRLQRGESLETLASQYSDDSSGRKGGDMGWFKRGQLIPAVENVVFALEEGEVTKPLRSPQGYHIFTVIEKRMVSPERDEKEKYRVKARHILIPVTSKGENEAVLQQMLKIRNEFVNDNVPFADLAKKYSKDGSAERGGELGWFGEGKMVPEFEKAAFALEVGQISDPIKSRFGWHLILLDDKEVLAPGSLEAKRKELTERVMESKTQMRYKQWLRDIRASAFVELK